MSTILIGIAGGTGSGKTTLTRHLKEHFGPEVTVIGHDNHYKRQDGKTLEERAKVNYDHPAAFDTELLIEHLKELKDAGLIQGEIETPKVKYCINRVNWEIARQLFANFFADCVKKKETCCDD